MSKPDPVEVINQIIEILHDVPEHNGDYDVVETSMAQDDAILDVWSLLQPWVEE